MPEDPTILLLPGPRAGAVELPASKSHLHRLLIAEHLAGWNLKLSLQAHDSAAQEGARGALPPCTGVHAAQGGDRGALPPCTGVHAAQGGARGALPPCTGVHAAQGKSPGADLQATQACLAALASATPILPCGESASTLRFLLPVAMLSDKVVTFTADGNLPKRPIAPFLEILRQHGVEILSGDFPLRLHGPLLPGEFLVPGDISSQIITGLLFALPLLHGDSVIRLTTPLESRGYVDMTLRVLRDYGIAIRDLPDGYAIPGNQCYRLPESPVISESDWSSAAFWLAMNHLGSSIVLPTLSEDSAQPDRVFPELLRQLGGTIDVSQCPDLFPVLAVLAAATEGTTHFTGTHRLRLKECDRVNAMAEMLHQLGATTTEAPNAFTVFGIGHHFHGGITLDSHHDHRIAMSAAVAATIADAPITLRNPACTAKSYPDFFPLFQNLHNLTGNCSGHFLNQIP